MKLYSYLRVIIQAVNGYWKWIILWTNFPQRSSAILAKSPCIYQRRLWLIALNKFSPLQQGKRIFINKGQGTRSGLPTTRTVAHAHHAWGGCQFKLYRATATTAFDHEVSFLKVDTVFLHSTSGQTRSTWKNFSEVKAESTARAREGARARYWQKLTVDPRMIGASKTKRLQGQIHHDYFYAFFRPALIRWWCRNILWNHRQSDRESIAVTARRPRQPDRFQWHCRSTCKWI